MTRTSENLEDRVRAVRLLLDEFKLERYVYISVIGVCLIILLSGAITAMVKASFDNATVVAMFGPCGVIAAMAGRLLKMWDRATEIISQRGSS